MLQARPLARFYRFSRWTGACAGQGPSCTVAATALSTVTAVFLPKDPGAAVALNVLSPNFSVRWVRGVGNGAVVVRGSVARRSRLTLQVRRPGGGPVFLFKYLTASGAFVQKLSLGPGEFPPGAQLFPGGFVVSVTGTTGGFQLPLQLKTVVLRSPSEGVVRQAFPSAREPREWCAASLPARDEGGVGELPLRHAAAQAATPSGPSPGTARTAASWAR